MYDAVLFDFFGVIFDDPQKPWLERCDADGKKAVANAARLLDTGKITYDEYMERLASAGDASLETVRAEFQSSILLNRDVVATIAELGDRGSVGLLSNTCTEEITPLFNQHDLHPLFDSVVISSETGMAKPDHAIFSLAVERLGSTPERTVFVDDNSSNVAAAAEVGLTAVHFQNVQQLRDDLTILGVLPADGGQEKE
jgi:HAD superfamily hydrolase (TIGR01509 family)